MPQLVWRHPLHQRDRHRGRDTGYKLHARQDPLGTRRQYSTRGLSQPLATLPSLRCQHNDSKLSTVRMIHYQSKCNATVTYYTPRFSKPLSSRCCCQKLISILLVFKPKETIDLSPVRFHSSHGTTTPIAAQAGALSPVPGSRGT